MKIIVQLVMKRYCYTVAGFPFDIFLPETIEINKALPNFIPFYSDDRNDYPIFNCKIYNEDCYKKINERKLIEKSESDLGTVRLYLCGNYYIADIDYGQNDYTHH